MNLLITYIGKDILTIIKNYFDNDEWYYLNNEWEKIEFIMDFAVETNRMSLLQWCHEKKTPLGRDNYLLPIEAITNGNFEMLKFLVNIGCKLTKLIYIHAHERGCSEIVKWAWENNCPIEEDYVMDILKEYNLF